MREAWFLCRAVSQPMQHQAQQVFFPAHWFVPRCFDRLPPPRFKSYSKYPPCYKDVAFWISDAFTENNL